MSLSAVIKAFHIAGIQPTGLEIAEMLWLAQHLVPSPEPSEVAQTHSALTAEGADDTDEQTPWPISPQPAPVPLSTPSSAFTGSPVRGHPVAVPGIPGLERRQDLQRALRPLRRYGPSRRHRVIDEDATASFIANTGVWTPITRPAPERWFDVVLAVDSSSSMDLWGPLISDLRAVLVGTGAFRDVRTWRLRPQHHVMVLPPNPGAAPRSPRELIDGAGRRLFLVVTDGAARAWHDGSATDVLADWSSTGSVAILQPLPEHMWTRTGLATVPVLLSTRAPGTPNSQLRVDSRRRRPMPGIPIPVLGLEPKALHSWARLVASSASAVPLAATPAKRDDRPTLLPTVRSHREAGTAVERFRASASPVAYQLAVCLSAVPLTLPIMRLVQHVSMPSSNTSALAEVILGGLISRTSDSIYEFLPGVREELLGELRRSELAVVFSAVSDYITRHAGTASQTFAAIAESGDGPVVAGAEPFSWVPPAVADRLGLPISAQYQQSETPDTRILSKSDLSTELVSNVGAEITATDVINDVHVHDITTQSEYLEQLRLISPPTLIGRDEELADLARFCISLEAGPYAWWQGGPWGGKTALMSWFVLHPPPGVQLVCFFITHRLAGEDTRDAFTEALIDQLEEVVGPARPLGPSGAPREAYLLTLIRQAAQACRTASQRLVLVVDGLDEDRGATIRDDARSIAALLPADPPAGMRVIVTGRSNATVPADVPPNHPLRDPSIIRMLAVSPQSKDIRQQTTRELHLLVGDDPLERDVVGLLTAARGGLSGPDLVELTSAPLPEVERILGAWRSFELRESRWAPQTAPQLYSFANEEVQATASQSLGDTLVGYRDRLNAWATTYRARGWPSGTPEYLLNAYFYVLTSLGDVRRMLDLILDPSRQARMRDFTGNDEACLAEIATTAAFMRDHALSDTATLTRLADVVDSIEQADLEVSINLPIVWAALGRYDRAESLARSFDNPLRQADALTYIVPYLAAAGDYDKAERLAHSIDDTQRRTEALTSIARTLAAVGDGDQAERLARTVAEAERLARIIVDRDGRERAIAALSQVIATDPNFSKFRASQPSDEGGELTAQSRSRDLAGSAANAPLDDPSDVASLLAVLRESGADDEVAILLARDPAGQVTVRDMRVVGLLQSLRDVDADAQFRALAARAAMQGALDNASIVARLLQLLRECSADDQLATLLARDPAAEVRVDDIPGIARLLIALRDVGADNQVRSLGARAVAQASLIEPSAAVDLIPALEEVGAIDQAAALLARMRQNADPPDAELAPNEATPDGLASRPAGAATEPGNRLRILCVDPGESWRELVVQGLADLHVDAVDSLPAAIALLDSEPAYDIALTELNLTDDQDMQGGALLDLLRARYPETKRIVITGSPPTGGIRHVLERYDVEELIIKGNNFNIPNLRGVVEQAVRTEDDDLPRSLRLNRIAVLQRFRDWQRYQSDRLSTARREAEAQLEDAARVSVQSSQHAQTAVDQAQERERQFRALCVELQETLATISSEQDLSAAQAALKDAKDHFGNDI
jgi:CheY-like chemotaxis protein